MKVGRTELELSGKWTPEERIAVVTVLLGAVQKDIYAGKYSVEGRPNITSVLHVLHEDAATLNVHHNSLEIMLRSINDDFLATEGELP